MFCGKATFCKGGTYFVLGKSRKFFPDFFDTAIGILAFYFLFKVANLKIFALFAAS